MALAGRWAFASPVVVIPKIVIADFAALLASFLESFAKLRVGVLPLSDGGDADSQGFGDFNESHPLTGEPKNQASPNIEILGHEGKFAENRVVVEFSTTERVDDRYQIDERSGLM